MTLTPTQQRILTMLSDGNYHTKEELHKCLVDELGPSSNVRVHITAIRKTLQPNGEDIIVQRRPDTCLYRHVRLVPIED